VLDVDALLAQPTIALVNINIPIKDVVCMTALSISSLDNSILLAFDLSTTTYSLIYCSFKVTLVHQNKASIAAHFHY